MPNFLKVILLIVILSDLIFLNFSFFKKQPNIIPTVDTPTPVIPDTCGPDCQRYIDSKIAKITISAPTQIPTTKINLPIKSKVRSVSYLPIPASGFTSDNSWVDLPSTDFYIDTHDYTGLVEIYFETNMHLFNGNGTAFVRLFDVTHGVGVQGSEVQVSKQADTAVVSGKVSFYAGKNLIRVQAKSLTADTTIFTSGRLRIVTEN